jgi:hybrid cluster-associated redox disulfide protein
VITAKMTIADILRKRADTEEVLKGFGMHCFGCAIASEETLEQAAKSHEVDINKLLEALNK